MLKDKKNDYSWIKTLIASFAIFVFFSITQFFFELCASPFSILKTILYTFFRLTKLNFLRCDFLAQQLYLHHDKTRSSKICVKVRSDK